MEAELDTTPGKDISDNDGLTIICNTLSNEINRECAKSPINTGRVRVLTEELDKFRGLCITSIDDIGNRDLIHEYPRGGAYSLPVPNVADAGNGNNSMLDSVKDIAHLLLKNSENKALVGNTSDLISWHEFLGTVSQDLTNRSILSVDELLDLEDSILTAIVKSMKMRINNVMSFNENAFDDVIETEV